MGVKKCVSTMENALRECSIIRLRLSQRGRRRRRARRTRHTRFVR